MRTACICIAYLNFLQPGVISAQSSVLEEEQRLERDAKEYNVKTVLKKRRERD